MNRDGSTSTGQPDRLMAVLRLVFMTVFCTLAAWLTIRLILALFVPSSTWEPVLIADAGPIQARTAVSYDFSYNPFAAGDADNTEIPPVDTGDDAPETTLNLTLKGLRSGLNGTAFIRTPDGQEDNYYIGDTIMPNVVLRGVFPTHVLIDVNGQTQRLTTEDAKTAARATRSTSAPQSTGLRTLGTVDATQLLSQVELVPSFDREMQRNGLLIKARNSSADLSAFGLQSGDIITRFAGQSLMGGMPDIVAIRQAAGAGRPVVVDLIRNGQPMTITIGSSS